MPSKACLDQALDANDANSPILDDVEIKEICRFVNKLADTVSEGQVIHRGNLVKITIEGNDVTLECADKQSSCTGQVSLQTPAPGRQPLLVPTISGRRQEQATLPR